MFSKKKNQKDEVQSEFMKNLLKLMTNFEDIREEDLQNKQFRDDLTPEEHSFAIQFITIKKFRKSIMNVMADQIKTQVKDQTKHISSKIAKEIKNEVNNMFKLEKELLRDCLRMEMAEAVKEQVKEQL